MKVVEKLDKKFALIDLEADVVDSAQQMSETGQLQLDGVVGEDVGDPGRRFLDPVGDLTDWCAPAVC